MSSGLVKNYEKFKTNSFYGIGQKDAKMFMNKKFRELKKKSSEPDKHRDMLYIMIMRSLLEAGDAYINSLKYGSSDYGLDAVEEMDDNAYYAIILIYKWNSEVDMDKRISVYVDINPAKSGEERFVKFLFPGDKNAFGFKVNIDETVAPLISLSSEDKLYPTDGYCLPIIERHFLEVFGDDLKSDNEAIVKMVSEIKSNPNISSKKVKTIISDEKRKLKNKTAVNIISNWKDSPDEKRKSALVRKYFVSSSDSEKMNIIMNVMLSAEMDSIVGESSFDLFKSSDENKTDVVVTELLKVAGYMIVSSKFEFIGNQYNSFFSPMVKSFYLAAKDECEIYKTDKGLLIDGFRGNEAFVMKTYLTGWMKKKLEHRNGNNRELKSHSDIIKICIDLLRKK